MWKNMEKQLFFRAAMAGLGKYHMGGYGRIGVYRVKFNGEGAKNSGGKRQAQYLPLDYR